MERKRTFLTVLVFSICVIIFCIISESLNRESFSIEKMYIKGNASINRTFMQTQMINTESMINNLKPITADVKTNNSNISILNSQSTDMNVEQTPSISISFQGESDVHMVNSNAKRNREYGKPFFAKRKNDSREKRTKNRLLKDTESKSCLFTFEKKSVLKTRQKLSELQQQSSYLFYINLFTNNKLQNFSEQERDNLLHWQYALKKEKFLLKLPIDFDVISFDLLFADNEENILHIETFYNNSDCNDNFTVALRSLRFLLWNEIFSNDTKYFLCNRKFEDVNGRMWLYAITTIWIGYDLSCSTVANEEFEDKKDNLPLVAPIFSYFLSLQFVWIFVILDISCRNKKNTDDKQNFAFNKKPYYLRKDRPYGLKQCILKLLFSDCCKYSHKCKPPMRVIVIMLIFICVIGLYRTLARYFLGMNVYENYLSVVLPSEWLIHLIHLHTTSSLAIIVVLDVVYAVLFPLIYIWLGGRLYESFLSKELHLCPLCLGGEDKDRYKLNDDDRMKDNFILPCYLLCATCYKSPSHRNRCMIILLFFSSFFPICSFSCNAFNACLCRCIDCKSGRFRWLRYIYMCLAFVLSYLFCLRPIISSFTFVFRSFTYFVFVALPIRKHIMRYTIIFVSTFVYLVKYMYEIINMNADILEYIFKIKEEKEKEQRTESNGTEIESESKTDEIDEAMFDFIYKRLFFVKKKLYYFIFKLLIVFMYLFITIETLIDNQSSLTGSDFKDILELVLVVIGPYAVSLFLKANKEEFLSDKNKLEIEDVYKLYIKNGHTDNKAINETRPSASLFDDVSEETNLIESERRQSNKYV